LRNKKPDGLEMRHIMTVDEHGLTLVNEFIPMNEIEKMSLVRSMMVMLDTFAEDYARHKFIKSS
jgi:hypothetical protein